MRFLISHGPGYIFKNTFNHYFLMENVKDKIDEVCNVYNLLKPWFSSTWREGFCHLFKIMYGLEIDTRQIEDFVSSLMRCKHHFMTIKAFSPFQRFLYLSNKIIVWNCTVVRKLFIILCIFTCIYTNWFLCNFFYSQLRCYNILFLIEPTSSLLIQRNVNKIINMASDFLAIKPFLL